MPEEFKGYFTYYTMTDELKTNKKVFRQMERALVLLIAKLFIGCDI